MRYAVAFSYILKNELVETGDFCYLEQGNEDIYFVEADSKENAARKYLVKYYEDNITTGDSWINDELLFINFIEYSIDGDPLFIDCKQQHELETLGNEIYDYVLNQLVLDGMVTIYEKNGNHSFSFPSNINKYINLCYHQYQSHMLIDLLSREEKKQGFISALLSDISVIELKEL